MKRILYITVCLAVALTSVSCEKFFDRVPEDKFAANAFFKTENDLILYTNGLINTGTQSATSITMGDDLYTDFCATRDSKKLYEAGYHNPGIATGWAYSNWGFLRQIAYMLENMENAKENVAPEKYNHYEGVARFWRAHATYNKVKSFGDCYFIDHVVSPSDSTLLYGPRQDREYIVHRIIEDLDFAVEYCLTSGANVHTDGRIYINKYVALALGARILLHEGTFRKYHTVNPSTGKPWNNEYETSEEIIEKAYNYAKQLVESNAFKLHGNFREIFTSKSLVTDEVIWGLTCSAELSVSHNTTYPFCSTTSGKLYSPTKDYVRMFLNTDGTPARPDLSVTEEFNNRDKRLAATVLAPGQKRQNQSGADMDFAPDFTWTATGYLWMKWLMTDYAAMTLSSGTSYNSIPYLRYAETLLIYAEAAAELGKMDAALWDSTIGEIRRTHGGVTSIYPGDAAYREDVLLRDYYTRGLAHADAGISNILLEIRRERATELMMEGSSHHDDLIRWNIGDLIERRYNGNAWRGIYLSEAEVKNGWTFNGKKYTVSTTKNTSETNIKLTSAVSQGFTLTDGDSGYLLYHYNVTWEDKMYVMPIPTTAINVNPNLGQNEGWQWM